MSKLAKCPLCGEEMDRNERHNLMCFLCGIEFYHDDRVTRLARLVREGRLKLQMDKEFLYIRSLGSRSAVSRDYDVVRKRAVEELRRKRREKR